MGPAWGLHGTCMGPAWGLHGACMGPAWGLHGACMGPAWGLHGACMGLIQGRYRIVSMIACDSLSKPDLVLLREFCPRGGRLRGGRYSGEELLGGGGGRLSTVHWVYGKVWRKWCWVCGL